MSLSTGHLTFLGLRFPFEWARGTPKLCDFFFFFFPELLRRQGGTMKINKRERTVFNGH